MFKIIFKLYSYLFSKKIFEKLNKFLYYISLRGLGILNYEDEFLRGEKAWLRRYLRDKKNPVVLDVGANVGDYSKDVLSANINALVFAFEPHPLTYKKLIENINSTNFRAFNTAVGDKRKTIKLYDFDTQDGSSLASLYKEVIQDIHKGNPIAHFVEMIPLDDFLKSQNIKTVDLLKIDTEGNEFNVLLGCKEFLGNNQIKAIQFEFNEMNIISKVSFRDFWKYLRNYDFYRILPGGKLLKITDYSPIFCEIYAYQNIVAILRDDR